ncbi:tetratricopeptide repeat protein [Pseudofulvibacter geojedonensis]|uniref:Tetratricopeptide repeat protein n=1 Tax=Pseudofulvibacter geojedonensis TaxID=1123758 RepID=A0ABW3HZ94_9FLAO
MKKKVLAIALLGFATMTMAQKNEVKALEKAIKSGNLANVKSLISTAEGVIGNADDKTKAKFYYLKAKAVLSGKDYDGIVKALADFEANKSNKYEAEISQLKTELSGKIVNEAIEDANKGKHEASAKKLLTAYRLNGDQEYLYYAANTYISAKKYDKSLPLLEELKQLDYTGVKTQYMAYNTATKKDEAFPNKQMRTLALKTGTHIKPTEKQTPSVKAEIIKNIALIHVNLGNTEKAITAIKDARANDPNDVSLIITEANLYLELGKKEEFTQLMKTAVEKDPNNPGLFFNLGVMSAENGDRVKAREYYQKSLDLRGDDINTNFNMAALILEDEKPLVEKMNSLGTSSADNKKYDLLQKQRNELYKSAVPYLEKILTVDAKNLDAAKTLKNIYGVLADMDNVKRMKAIIEAN